MNKNKLDEIRENPNRTLLMMVNEVSKAFEDSVLKNKEILFMTDKTSRNILAYLSHKRVTNQQELVRFTQMKASTVSVAITKMQELGYVKREPSESDMRSVKISLTKKGLETSDLINKSLKERDESIMKGISEKDIRTAKYVLEKMLDNIVFEK